MVKLSKAEKKKIRESLQKRIQKQRVRKEFYRPGYQKGTKRKAGLVEVSAKIGRALTGETPKRKVAGRGRGRPEGSYKYIIPGVGPVPIDVFKKWKTQMKAQARLQAELKAANLSAAMPEDPRYQYDESDQFLDAESPEEAMMKQQLMAQQQMQQQIQRGPPMQRPMQRRPGMIQRLLAQRQRLQQPTPGGFQRPPMSAGIGVQRMEIWGRPEENILNTRNIFNNPNETRVRP